MIGKAAPRKLDLGKTSIVRAHNKAMWPRLTDLTRWPAWLRSPDGRSGLASVTPLATPAGTVSPDQPELGKRYRFAFTNGLAGDFQVTYWLYPAQISLGLVRDTRADAHGVEGLIFDCDLFPQRDGTTQLWFSALVMLERGYRPSLLGRWPKREVQSWVEGFHRRVAAEAPAWPRAREDEAPAPPAR